MTAAVGPQRHALSRSFFRSPSPYSRQPGPPRILVDCFPSVFFIFLVNLKKSAPGGGQGRRNGARGQESVARLSKKTSAARSLASAQQIRERRAYSYSPGSQRNAGYREPCANTRYSCPRGLLCKLVGVAVLFLAANNLARQRHLVEDVPCHDADDGVVAHVEHDALAVPATPMRFAHWRSKVAVWCAHLSALAPRGV